MRVSVVICTYNRVFLLKGCLESLVKQTCGESHYEVIIVDNNCIDNTEEMARGFIEKYPNIHYIKESKQGLSYSRNRGLQEAGGEYIAFMDDDARADLEWVKVAIQVIDEFKPDVFGGPIHPFYLAPKPAWFRDEYETRTWGDQPRFLKKGESFSGSNMVFRKVIFGRFGGFNENTGMVGEYLGVGEETDLFEKIWKDSDGVSVLYYSPQLIVNHYVPPFKFKLTYRLKRAFMSGQSWYQRNGSNKLLDRLVIIIFAIANAGKFGFLMFSPLRKYSTYHNWVVERFVPIANQVGRLSGCLGFHFNIKTN